MDGLKKLDRAVRLYGIAVVLYCITVVMCACALIVGAIYTVTMNALAAHIVKTCLEPLS